MTTPGGVTQYQYDAAGRATSLIDPFNHTSSWSYLGNNWLTLQTLGNGASTSYTYNAMHQLTELTNRAPGSTLLSQYSAIAYDGKGNRTAVTSLLPGLPAFSGTTNYTPDAKGQLLQEVSTRNGGYDALSVYDYAGNPTTFLGQTHTYNANNQITDTGFAYDNNGNPTTYKGETLAFDSENRMTAYGTILTAGYNGDGLRAWKETANGRIYFLYDGIRPVCELQVSDNVLTLSAVNTFGANGLLSRHESGRELWYQFDSEGNVAQRLDVQGTVLSSDLYDAWGNLLAGGDTSDSFGYKAKTGYYIDQETGLLFCTLRYYDPRLGRWATRDPLGFAGGINLYRYCANAPVSFIDPSGQQLVYDACSGQNVGWYFTELTDETDLRQSYINYINITFTNIAVSLGMTIVPAIEASGNVGSFGPINLSVGGVYDPLTRNSYVQLPGISTDGKAAPWKFKEGCGGHVALLWPWASDLQGRDNIINGGSWGGYAFDTIGGGLGGNSSGLYTEFGLGYDIGGGYSNNINIDEFIQYFLRK